MRKIFCIAALFVFTAILTACGGSQNGAPTPETPKASVKETGRNTGATGKRILVAYFSRADENYGVGNIEKGNTRILAEMIADMTGADTFEIRPAKPYPKEYTPATEVAKREKNENARPEIVGTLPNVRDYDVIFLGYPIWWGDLPMAVYTFLDKSDFSGKIIVPFCTHEGSGLSGTNRYIAEATKAEIVLEALVMQGATAQNSRDEAKEKVADWLKKLGYAK